MDRQATTVKRSVTMKPLLLIHLILSSLLLFAACSKTENVEIDDQIYIFLFRLTEKAEELKGEQVEEALRAIVAEMIARTDESGIPSSPTKVDLKAEFESAIEDFSRSELSLPVYMQELVDQVDKDTLSHSNYRVALFLLRDFQHNHDAR